MPTLEVRFHHGEKKQRIRVPLTEGERLLGQLLRNGVALSHDCEGALACASCAVIVHDGAATVSAADADEQDLLEKAGLDAEGARLSCCTVAGAGDLVIEIPRAGLPEPSPAGPALAISLTERAAGHLRAQLAKRAGVAGVRLGVQAAGCSGMRYRLDYAASFEPGDKVFESAGVRIAVAPESLPFVQGTRLDFVTEGLAWRLRFDNPNVRQTCGCGESFGV